MIWLFPNAFFSQDSSYTRGDIRLNAISIDTNAMNQFPFIDFDQNYFQFPSDSNPNWDSLYENLDSMILLKDRKNCNSIISEAHIFKQISIPTILEALFNQIGLDFQEKEDLCFHLILLKPIIRVIIDLAHLIHGAVTGV